MKVRIRSIPRVGRSRWPVRVGGRSARAGRGGLAVAAGECVLPPLVEPFTGLAFALSRTPPAEGGQRDLGAARAASGAGGQAAGLTGRPAPRAGAAGVRLAACAGPAERALFPVPTGQRAAVFDESLALLRLMLTRDGVVRREQFFTVSDAKRRPAARQADGYLAGRHRRLAACAGWDGWRTAGSARCSPRPRPPRRWKTINQAAAGNAWMEEPRSLRAQRAGRAGPHPDPLRASISRRGPDTDPETVVASGWDGSPACADRAVRRGRPEQVRGPARVPEPESFGWFVDAFVRELMPLQN